MLWKLFFPPASQFVVSQEKSSFLFFYIHLIMILFFIKSFRIFIFLSYLGLPRGCYLIVVLL